MNKQNNQNNKPSFRPTPTQVADSLKILTGVKTNSTIRDLEEEEGELEEKEGIVVSIQEDKINGAGWTVKDDKGELYVCSCASNMYDLPETKEHGGVLYPSDNVKVIFSGRGYPLPDKVLKAMDVVTKDTANNTGLVLNICINYGGRAEIVDMTKKLCKLYSENKISIDDIDYDLVSKNLYQDLPDIDLVIRTSGEFRVSNFMLYQSSYAEFYFTKVLFPDFNEKEFDKAILEFNNRDRKFGG